MPPKKRKDETEVEGEKKRRKRKPKETGASNGDQHEDESDSQVVKAQARDFSKAASFDPKACVQQQGIIASRPTFIGYYNDIVSDPSYVCYVMTYIRLDSHLSLASFYGYPKVFVYCMFCVQ